MAKAQYKFEIGDVVQVYDIVNSFWRPGEKGIVIHREGMYITYLVQFVDGLSMWYGAEHLELVP